MFTVKKFVFGIISLCLVFSLGLTNGQHVFSQDVVGTEYEQDFKTYTLTLETYSKAHDDYILARAQYLRFGTLTSQNEAREATRQMLATRDDVVIAYLEALRSWINQAPDVEVASRERLNLALDTEVAWFTDHKGNLVGAGSLADLVNDSNAAKVRYNTLGPDIYEILSQVPVSRTKRFSERLDENFLGLKDKMIEIRAETRPEYQFSTRKLESIDRWILETESRITRSNQKLTETQVFLDDFIKSKTFPDAISRYNQILSRLGITLQDLRDASLYMKEITKEIKTK